MFANMFGEKNFMQQQTSVGYGQEKNNLSTAILSQYLNPEKSHLLTSSLNSTSCVNQKSFMRLDSTGESTASNTVIRNPFSVHRTFMSRPNMFSVKNHINRELGFGHKYYRKSRSWPSDKSVSYSEAPSFNHLGYPFHQFAMPTQAADVAVEFVGFHGESQVINLTQLAFSENQYMDPSSWEGKNHCAKRTTSCTVEMPPKKQSTEAALCDYVQKLTLNKPICEAEIGDNLPTDTKSCMQPLLDVHAFLNEQLTNIDSGYYETTHILDDKGRTETLVNCMEETLELKDEEVTDMLSADTDAEDMIISPPEISLPPALIIDFNIGSESDAEEDDLTDSELEFDDDSDDEDFDHSAEFELLSCFFPDDPFNPLNFNRTCALNRSFSNKRSYSDKVCDSELSEISRSTKRVRFVSDSKLEEVHREDDALAQDYQDARCGPWEDYARQRDRFKRRVQDLEPILAPCFSSEHRCKIFTHLQES